MRTLGGVTRRVAIAATVLAGCGRTSRPASPAPSPAQADSAACADGCVVEVSNATGAALQVQLGQFGTVLAVVAPYQSATFPFPRRLSRSDFFVTSEKLPSVNCRQSGPATSDTLRLNCIPF